MGKALVISKGQKVFTDSLMVAENFGKKHNMVLRKIENLIREDENTQLYFALSDYKDSTGRTLKKYVMDRRSFTILSMGFTGKKAFEWKNRFLDAFESMEKALLQKALHQQSPEWIALRQTGKLTHRTKTDTIKDFVGYAMSQGSKSADRYYMAIARMENQALFLLEQKFKNLRDILNLDQLATIKVADAIVFKAIKDGMDAGLHYKDIYQLAKKRVESLADLHGKTFIPVSQQLRLKA